MNSKLPAGLGEALPAGTAAYSALPAAASLHRARHLEWVRLVLCPLLLIGVAAVTYMTSAHDEDFWWADGASFALNGDFLRDYLTSGFGQNPMTFALAWFDRYPALTISLYPPVFPLAEAVVFAIFGFSHAAAQATVGAFSALALYGMYRTARPATGPLFAAAAAVLLFATPEVLRWSREIVLDVPEMAFLLLAAAALLRYQAAGGTKTPLAAVLLVLAAVYTKQTALFVAPAFAVALLADAGWPLLRRKSTWIAVAVFAAGLLPLAIFTALFATENFHIAFGSGTGQKEYARLSFAALAAYGRVLPDIVGWLPLGGAAAYLILAAFKGWRDRNERRLAVLMLSWFVVDYLAISVTADFEPRYAMLLTVPPVMLTVLLITRLAAARWAGAAALALGMGMFVTGVRSQPVIRVEGFGDAAQYVLEHARQDSVVLFHGMASKNFAFAVRSRSPTPKIFILRAEKYLVDYRIMRAWGITDRNLTSAQVEDIVDRHNVSYIVFQPGFWTDQPSVAMLQELIDSGRFRLVGQFYITSEDTSRNTVLRVYQNVGKSQPPGGVVGMSLPRLPPIDPGK